METNFRKCVSTCIYNSTVRTNIINFIIQNTGHVFFGKHCNILERISILFVNIRLHFLLKKECEMVKSNINGRNRKMLKLTHI